MSTHYATDLAYIHDAGFTGFVRDASPGLLQILRQHRITLGLVVDLGCGSGVWARELAGVGYQVLGVDISEAMLRLARRRAPKARFMRASLFRMTLPPCAAVTAIGECVNYLFDRTNSQRELRRFFRRVHDALQPGGVFVFDVAAPGRAPKPTERYFIGDDWAILVRNDEDKKSRVLTRRMTIFRKVGKLYRRSEETHRQRLYSRQEVTRELQQAGFRVRVISAYGHARFGRGHLGFVAKKRELPRGQARQPSSD
jgi:SAM-dependent methyltransferase